MKKILIFTLSLLLSLSTFSQSHNHPVMKKSFSDSDLKGFDHNWAWQQARKKSKKINEQEEYFQALQRRYVYEKRSKGPQVKGRGNQNWSATYDPMSKVTNVNLTPYNAYCPNAGFENGNYGNWQGFTYTNAAATNWNTFTPTWVPGVVTVGTNIPVQANWLGVANPYPNRHTLMTIPPTVNNPPFNLIGWDSICIQPSNHLSEVEFVPSTANGVTCRLGNCNNTYNETERLIYTVNVTPNNTQFTYSYAVVIYDGGHAPGEQPFFKITAKDQFGNSFGGACGQYQIDATMVSTDPDFEAASYYQTWNSTWVDPSPGVPTNYYYKKWTPVAIDLTPYIGTTVTIEFQTGDCIFGGHWAYAYVDATCQPSGSTVNFCTGSSSAVLVGPPGYATYTWAGPNNLTPIPGATNDTLIVSNASLGNVYTLTATTPSGCTSTFSVTIAISTIGVQNTFSTPSCVSGSSGSAQVIATGSPTGYNYSWTGPNGPVGGNSSQITGLPPGTYSVSITGGSCGQKDTTITVGIAPPIYYSQVQQFCLSPANVVAPTGSNYQWYGPNGNLLSSTSNPLVVQNPIAGQSYTTVFTNSQGCKDSVKITLTQQVNVQNQNVTFCGNVATLQAPTGATGVIWYDANFPYSQIGTGPTFVLQNPVVSQFNPYYYSYTNPQTGCRDSVELYLTQIAGSTFATSLQPACPGQSSGSCTINLSTTQAGPYSFGVTGPNGYTNSFTGIPTTTQNLTGLASGTYNIVASDAVCSYVGTFTISTLPVPVSITLNPACIGSGDTSFVTFSYGAGGTTGVCGTSPVNCVTPNIVQVGNGVTQNTSTTWPAVYGNWYSNEKYQILYRASDLQAMGLTAGKFSSIGFQVVSIPAGMNTTFLSYTIKISCTSVNDLGSGFGVPFIAAPFVTVWGPQNYTINTGWNTHNFTQAYEWDGVSNIIVEICYNWVGSSNYTTNAITNNVATPYNSFSVYYSDTQPACPATTTNQIYTQRPNTRFGHCVGQSLASDFTYNWSWNPTNGLNNTPGVPTNLDPTVEIIANGTTQIDLSITSNVGNCTIDTTFTISVINPFNLSVFGDTTICSNANPIPLQAITTDPTTGLQLPVSGSWSGPGITNLGNGSGQFNPQVSGPGQFNLIYTAGSSVCGGTSFKKDTVVVTVSPFLSANFNNFGPFCDYELPTNLTTLATNPGGQWYINGQSSSTFNPQTLGASNPPGHEVKYVVDLGFGCPDSVTKYVQVFLKPQISFITPDTAGCLPNLPIQFTSVGGAAGNYLWSFGDGSTSTLVNPSHIYNTVGSFNVQLQYVDLNGCKDTATQNSYIDVYPIPNPNFVWDPNPGTIVNSTISFYNLTPNNNGLIWDWDFAGLDSSNVFNPTYTFQNYGVFPVTLTAINPFGCEASVTRPIVIELDAVMYIPNAFTPNGDGVNDGFRVSGFGYSDEDFSMSIYNRWGEKIFETFDPNQSWKGEVKGNGMVESNEVFVYRVTFRDLDRKFYTRVGHVTVVR